MNKSGWYSPNSENYCCYCTKKDYSPRSFKGALYSESSPSEDNGDDNECRYQTFRNIDGTVTRDEVYDNLLDIIDDQMMSTMSALRKKARKFMKSEFEQSFSSDSTSHPCSHKEGNISKVTSVMRKANEIDYQPQSTFLKKMVQQYQCRQIDLNDSDFPGPAQKGINLGNKDQNRSKSPAMGNQWEKSDGCCCKCHSSAHGKEESSEKKSRHVSRSKKKTKGARKRRSDENCHPSDLFDPDLKQPKENSCERCWRFASPSRSPVNKPDQRYDPNYRRGHSLTNLNDAKAEDLVDEKLLCALQDKNESAFDTTLVTKKTPKSTTSKKLNQVQSAPCEDYSPQFNPFNKAGVSRLHSNEQPKSCNNEAKTFDFEYPSIWLSETFQNQQRQCAPRPRSCDKPKEKNSLEKGIIYSSKVRNLLSRPQPLVTGRCNANREEEEEEYGGSRSYRDPCGRGRIENLDPCMKKMPPAAKLDPCQNENYEIPKMRGEGSSAENGSGRGSNGLGGGSGMGRNEFEQTANFTELSEIPVDPMGQLGGQADLNNIGKQKPGTGRNDALNDASSKKPSSATGSKSKAAKKNPLGEPKARSSPRGLADKKGGGKTSDNKRGTCLTNEAQAYFKIPDDSSNTPEECGIAHPVRHCRCYPRVVDENKDGDIYCCHCSTPKNERNKIRTNNAYEAVSPGRNEGWCSPRPTTSAYPEPTAYQGRRPPSRPYNQKPTLPNIDEYPEQLYDTSVLRADGTEFAMPCPYRMYMANRPLSYSTNMSQPRYQTTNLHSGNENFSFRDGNVPYRNQNANFPQMNGNENCPRYRNGNAHYMTYNIGSQMNGMEFPRKYCVMYMTKGKAATGDDVEVLVEELSQPCPYGTDDRMANVKEKMTRMYKCPTESMALRFEKGVAPRASVPQKSRVLYF